MAQTINQLMNYSWLSQASYLDLAGLSSNTTVAVLSNRLQSSAINDDKIFTLTQAGFFTGSATPNDPTDGFVVMNQRPNDASGFSATVFKANGANEYTVAVRGTENGSIGQIISDLFDADGLGVALMGRATSQLISAYRYYKQLTATAGQPIAYSAAEIAKLAAIYDESLIRLPIPIIDPAIRTARVALFVSELSDATLTDNIGLELLPVGATVNFTGHSLGGHVATLLAAMVQQFGQGAVGAVVTYNAPGQTEIFNTNTAVDVNAIAGKITNIIGEGGLSATAGFSPKGSASQYFLNNHATSTTH